MAAWTGEERPVAQPVSKSSVASATAHNLTYHLSMIRGSSTPRSESAGSTPSHSFAHSLPVGAAYRRAEDGDEVIVVDAVSTAKTAQLRRQKESPLPEIGRDHE